VEELIIEAIGVRKTYTTGAQQVEALRTVNFAVTCGEMVAIMGPSGCGKTTLLNCLSGLDEFDSGEIRIAGTSLREMNDNQKTEYRARSMGFVFQVYTTCCPCSVRWRTWSCPCWSAEWAPGRRVSAPCRPWSGWVWHGGHLTGPPSYPVGSASGSPWPAPWSIGRPSCGPMSPPGRWTPSRPPISLTCWWS